MTEKTPEEGDSYKLNIEEISRVLTELTRDSQDKENFKKIGELCDIYGGFGSVDAVVHKDVYVIHWGIDREYNLEVYTPAAIITYGGIRNRYSLSGIDPKNVFFITQGGIDNQYEKGQRLTVEEFRKKFTTHKSG